MGEWGVRGEGGWGLWGSVVRIPAAGVGGLRGGGGGGGAGRGSGGVHREHVGCPGNSASMLDRGGVINGGQ